MNRFFLVVLGVYLTGCAVTRIPYHREANPEYRPRKDYAQFRYDKFSAEVIPEESRETQNYLSYQIILTTPATDDRQGRKTTAQYLQSKTPGQKKLVIILPIYGSSDFPPQMLANNLTQWNPNADYHVLLLRDHGGLFDWKSIYGIKSEEELNREIKEMIKNTVEAVKDVRRMLDWTLARPEIDQKRIGITGFSIGAVTASLVAGIDERIKAGALVTGGVNPAYIITRSEAKFIARPRAIILKRLGWTQELLLEKIAPYVKIIDPVQYGKYINPERWLILEAQFDEYIPYRSREDLWRSLGKPEKILLPYSHKAAYLFSGTIFGLNYLDRTIAKFFDKKL